MEDALSQMQELDAVAAEHGGLLAFRIEDADGLEPVFIRVELAEESDEAGAAMIAISDRDGLPLGHYVLPAAKLRAALEPSLLPSA